MCLGLQGLLGVLSYVCMYVCPSLPESELFFFASVTPGADVEPTLDLPRA